MNVINHLVNVHGAKITDAIWYAKDAHNNALAAELEKKRPPAPSWFSFFTSNATTQNKVSPESHNASSNSNPGNFKAALG